MRLEQIIAEAIGSASKSVKTKALYTEMLDLGSELFILLKAPIGDIAEKAGEKVADGIARVRSGKVAIGPGFDGEYGEVHIWQGEAEKQEEERRKEQLGLF